MTGASMLELIHPPDGYAAVSGCWLTHDLDSVALVEDVLPTLAGAVASERARRLASLGALPERFLTVAYAADRLNAAGVTPRSSLELVPVSGRRQHAKLVVLRFARQPGVTGATTIWRVIVTSANLTHSGLRANREVYLVENIASSDKQRRPSYLIPALDALAQFGRSDGVSGSAVTKAVSALRRGVPTTLTPAMIQHSLREPVHILDALGAGPYSRLMLCAPTFVGKGHALGRRLAGLLGSGAHVDLVVPLSSTAGGLEVPVPQGVIDVLRDAGHSVEVWASPLFDSEGHQRRLHGKQYVAVRETGEAIVLVGSANLTKRGLLGENRELVAVIDEPDGRAFIDATLRTLHARRPSSTMPAPDAAGDLTSVVGTPDPLIVPFEPVPGSSPTGRIHGVLGRPGDQTPLRVDKKKHTPGKLTWLDRDASVEAKIDGKWMGAIVVLVLTDEAAFWGNVPSDDDPPTTDPLLRLLITDVERQSRPTSRSALSRAADSDPGRFDLPETLWLNVVTRHRRSLGPWLTGLEQQIEARLASDPERRVARAVLASHMDSQAGRQPALLAALRRHLERVEA